MSENINLNALLNEDANAQVEEIWAPFRADEDSPYIFISYAHADRKRVFDIITDLYEKGWKIWYDEGLPLGEDYYGQLAAHIRNCAVMLLFVTKNSVASKFVTENELEYGVKNNRRIIFCYLDEDAVVPEGIELATANEKIHPRTDQAGLEAALETIEGLTKGKPRTAEGFKLKSNVQIAAASANEEYEWYTVPGGVCLTKYNGSDTDVVVPSEYPAGSDQKVVKLDGTFYKNKTVRTVNIPATAKKITDWTFYRCTALTDVYIPSSVKELTGYGVIEGTAIIHCAENSAAYEYAKKNGISYIIDNTLDVETETETASEQITYACISYSADMQRRAEEIISKLEDCGCSIRDCGKLSGRELSKTIRECSCFAALISKGYVNGDELEDFRLASDMKKQKLIYELEDCQLPPDLNFEHDFQQKLIHDSQNEELRTAKLVEWLAENGCRLMTKGIPDFEYTAIKENGITLVKYTGSGGDVVIESEYDGLPVTSIGGGAFSGCSSLTNITIPDKVTLIGEYAFHDCSSLTSITIPDSVTLISNGAFSGCIELTSIAIPDSVTSIGDGAFSGCSRLTEITVSDSNTNYCDIDGVVFTKDKTVLVVFPGGRSNYVIPDNVTSIGDFAFSRCSGLTSITIPNGVTSIGKGAFSDCSELTKITIPDSVTSIGNGAFSGCSRLTSITIPDSVTSIGNGAFSGCSGLTSITISNKVTAIGRSTFSGCSGLESLTIPDKVTLIGNLAFYRCSGLTSITIPNRIISIGESAFSSCSKLKSITISDRIISIGENVFSDCPNLTVYCTKNACAWQYCEENKLKHKPLSALRKKSLFGRLFGR